MKDLIERLEKATGPDRELDAAIWLATTPGATRRQWSYTHTATGMDCDVDETRDSAGALITVPEYTASLDAALTLMPRGAVLQNLTLRMQPEMGGRMYSAVVWHGSLFASGWQRSFKLAVACAALKAREAREYLEMSE